MKKKCKNYNETPEITGEIFWEKKTRFREYSLTIVAYKYPIDSVCVHALFEVKGKYMHIEFDNEVICACRKTDKYDDLFKLFKKFNLNLPANVLAVLNGEVKRDYFDTYNIHPCKADDSIFQLRMEMRR